ncbi:hypothetical protein HY772_00680 [Candidatus Woesearchaeota archaeon]|nr:hypothetical protein [Candidatus Woesearchaeota archaeon]
MFVFVNGAATGLRACWICKGETKCQLDVATVKAVAQDLLSAAEYFLRAGNEQASAENYWLGLSV